MSALPKERIAGIITSYRDDPTATIATVAAAEGLTEQTIRKHLEAAGVPLRPEFDTDDEQLGIGAPVEDFTQTAAFRNAVKSAAAELLAEMGITARTAQPLREFPSEGSPDWHAFMRKMEELTESVNVQKPGYQKPLTPAELKSRAEGKAEFERLIREAKLAVHEFGTNGAVKRGMVPEYIVGEGGFYGNTSQGEMLFVSGQKLYLTAPPPEDFLPMNDAAGAIMRAQLQWHGEPTPPIEELVAQAMMRANGSENVAVIGSENVAREADAILIDKTAEPLDLRPKRTMGTSVPEQHGVGNGPFPQGANKAPAGPVFVN